MQKHTTRAIHLGGLSIGGGAPVMVQSMTNTDTRDAEATLAQIARLEARGCEAVRVAVPDDQADVDGSCGAKEAAGDAARGVAESAGGGGGAFGPPPNRLARKFPEAAGAALGASAVREAEAGLTPATLPSESV